MPYLSDCCVCFFKEMNQTQSCREYQMKNIINSREEDYTKARDAFEKCERKRPLVMMAVLMARRTLFHDGV